MRKLLIAIFTLMIFNVSAFAALSEESITKVLDKVRVAKEHKNIKAMRKYFLSRTSVSLSKQDIESSDTKRLSLNEYKRFLVKKWKKVKSNILEVQDRKINIAEDGKSALVKTTLKQTIEYDGVKTETIVYETTGIKLIKGRVYINYYSQRIMLNTALKVN